MSVRMKLEVSPLKMHWNEQIGKENIVYLNLQKVTLTFKKYLNLQKFTLTYKTVH